ncbi:uncharacterized protein N0V89_004973 [Didymosphaeria variabile]|uniref:Major facilitator superfamily (MFS) profile domain-containing protein n=1 Tax=Didymosphaeria variabile TaxID=1932322 RepID=A0A9W8XKG5_9PLEO|nr:uncharacterized protein N0V89_004973 [Didymosphaeria variabile]KAJ4353246.1 hypothetical protein N0V89_004973 [Didymosphaeria variabile]
MKKFYGGDPSHDEMIREQINEIEATMEYEKQHEAAWMSLIQPRSNLRRLIQAILTMVFFQITGSNTLVYFFPVILGSSGITSTKTIFVVMACLTGVIFFCVITGGWLSDKMGRKKLLVVGTVLMDVALIALAVLSYFSETRQSTAYGYGSIAVVLVFQLASYNSWMILNYSMSLEILNYAFNFIGIYTIPIALEKISWKYYILLASWNVVIIMVVIFFFKETGGKKLEEVDAVIDGESLDRDASLDLQVTVVKTDKDKE